MASRTKSTNSNEETTTTTTTTSATATKTSTRSRSSQEDAGVVHILTSLFAAAFDQWKQLVMFLSPYVEAVRSLPRRIFSDILLPCIEYTYNTLHEKFTDYTFLKFVADVVNVFLTVMLFPLMITVAIAKGICNRMSDSCAMCGDAKTNVCAAVDFSRECFNWSFAIGKDILKWTRTTYSEVRNGDMTCKEVWNEILDAIDKELRNGCAYFGEDSKFTWVVQTCKIGEILQKLQFGSPTTSKKED